MPSPSIPLIVLSCSTIKDLLVDMSNIAGLWNATSGGYFLADFLDFDDGAIPRGANATPLALVVGERAHVSLSTLRYMGEPLTEGFCELRRAGRITIA